MAFQEVQDLDCTAVALGGTDRKTNKANPTRVEGWYIGSRKVDSPKSKSGFTYLYVFQTAKGNLGVWGKTDLDIKMKNATLGAMTRVTFTGMQETKNNPMYKYKVEVDKENSIEVISSQAQPEASAEGSADDDALEDSDLDADEPLADEVPPARFAALKKALSTPSLERQAQIQALLKKRTG